MNNDLYIIKLDFSAVQYCDATQKYLKSNKVPESVTKVEFVAVNKCVRKDAYAKDAISSINIKECIYHQMYSDAMSISSVVNY